MSERAMWEILVPTVRPNTEGQVFFTTRFHRVWDEHVRKITGGLTICAPTLGQWVSPEGVLFVERMIPVRIMATEQEMRRVVDMTLLYYGQQAVMWCLISPQVRITYAPDTRNQS